MSDFTPLGHEIASGLEHPPRNPLSGDSAYLDPQFSSIVSSMQANGAKGVVDELPETVVVAQAVPPSLASQGIPIVLQGANGVVKFTRSAVNSAKSSIPVVEEQGAKLLPEAVESAEWGPLGIIMAPLTDFIFPSRVGDPREDEQAQRGKRLAEEKQSRLRSSADSEAGGHHKPGVKHATIGGANTSSGDDTFGPRGSGQRPRKDSRLPDGADKERQIEDAEVRQLNRDLKQGQEQLRQGQKEDRATDLYSNLQLNFDDSHPKVPARLGAELYNPATLHCAPPTKQDIDDYNKLESNRQRMLFLTLPGKNPTENNENLRHKFANLSSVERRTLSSLRMKDIQFSFSAIEDRVRQTTPAELEPPPTTPVNPAERIRPKSPVERKISSNDDVTSPRRLIEVPSRNEPVDPSKKTLPHHGGDDRRAIPTLPGVSPEVVQPRDPKNEPTPIELNPVNDDRLYPGGQQNDKFVPFKPEIHPGEHPWTKDHVKLAPVVASLEGAQERIEGEPLTTRGIQPYDYFKVTAWTGGKKLPLEPGKPVLIGKRYQPHLPEFVDPDHGTIEIHHDGQISYRDHSSNGTYVKLPGKDVDFVKNKTREIPEGSQIRLGDQNGPPVAIKFDPVAPVTAYVGGEEIPIGPPLGKEEVEVGRNFQQKINNHAVSRDHLKLRWTATGQVEITDKGSSNGTYWRPNGETEWKKLPSLTPTLVEPGDSIRLGSPGDATNSIPLQLKAAPIRMKRAESDAEPREHALERSIEKSGPAPREDVAGGQLFGNKYINSDGSPRQEDAFWIGPGGLQVICDGAGGHQGGRTAALIGVDTVKREYANYPKDGSDEAAVTSWMERTIIQANQNVLNARDGIPYKTLGGETLIGSSRMGSTILLSAKVGDKELVGWAGDSRLYRLRGNELEQLTTDDSPPGNSHQLTNALGILSKPNIKSVDIQPDDLFLGATDGLETLSADEIQAILQGAKKPADAVRDLMDSVERKNAQRQDNVTAVVYKPK